MARELTFEDPGEGITEGEIIEVLVSPGDEVAEGDEVLVVETDKASTDLPSPHSGTVEDVPVSVGDTVHVGDVLMTFSGDGEKGAAEEREEAGESEEPEEPVRAERGGGGRGGGKAAAVGELPEAEPAGERGEGPPERESREEKESGGQEGRTREAARREGGPVPASPATRRLARELDVDLRAVEPGGPHGRVTSDDVRAHAGEAPEGPEETAGRARPEEEAPDFERYGPVERVPLRGVRRATARRVATAWREIPHVTHHDDIDVTELERWRRSQEAQVAEQGGDLSLMVLVMKAVVGVLQRHPRFNASLDAAADEIVVKRHFHLGMAVDTDDGLLVPVVRDVDRIPMLDLAVEVAELVRRTRSRELEPAELKGGSFTITNVGPIGGRSFVPIVNYLEVAILGMSRTRLEQVVTGDLDRPRTDVRLLLPVSLSYDHRVNDGADAARFVSALGEALSDPQSLLLQL